MSLLQIIVAIVVLNALFFSWLRIRYIRDCNIFRRNLKPMMKATYQDEEGMRKCTIVAIEADDMVIIQNVPGDIMKLSIDHIFPPTK